MIIIVTVVASSFINFYRAYTDTLPSLKLDE